MKIEQALFLTKQDENRVCFIKDNGLFYKLYNQSAYIVIVLLNAKLKAYTRTIKKLNGETVIISGFPIHSLPKFFPDAKPTDWGFELIGHFDLSGYANWAEIVVQKQQQTTVNNKPAELAANLGIRNSQLTSQQLAYLANWERQKYPIDVDISFIESLKQHIYLAANER